MSPAEYLEIERQAEYKSEFFQGEMIAMERVNCRHALIVTNLVAELGPQLKPTPCQVYFSQLKVRVTPEFYTYLDVLVISDAPLVADCHDDIVLNPALIVEVLSPPTQDYDRGRKFERYRKLQSLVEYLTIAQDRPHVERWARQEDGWKLVEYGELRQVIQLTSVGAVLPLTDIYDKVDFDR